MEAVRRPLVLIVDDEIDIRKVAFAAISELGYQAIVAASGEEGIEVARTYKPDLILTDAFMPKMDGREMCRRIKANPDTARARVVVMTSLYTASRYKYEAFKEFQADDYLPKPLEFQALRELLEKHLGPRIAAAAPDA
jgi:CheY-like chemotaxis protein